MGKKGWKQKTVQKDIDVLKGGSIMAWTRLATERQVGVAGVQILFEGRAAQPHGSKNDNHTNHKQNPLTMIVCRILAICQACC